MNLYRLDILLPDGTSYPVADFVGPRLYNRRAIADRDGRAAAGYSERPVQLTRISGAGHTKIMGHFMPGNPTSFRKMLATRLTGRAIHERMSS